MFQEPIKEVKLHIKTQSRKVAKCHAINVLHIHLIGQYPPVLIGSASYTALGDIFGFVSDHAVLTLNWNSVKTKLHHLLSLGVPHARVVVLESLN